jgi:LysR family transcriptional regulator, regulator for genes of the gallate degradation pathway
VEHNLSHLRIFVTAAEQASLSRAAEICHLSQPAVTQAIAKLEQRAGVALLRRTRQGVFLSDLGQVFLRRVRRALAYLDRAVSGLDKRLELTATASQLRALVAVRDAESFTLAARQLSIAQPTVHRAVRQLEQGARCRLFEHTPRGTIVTRAGQNLADAARLFFVELAQAEMELAEATGRETGRIVIGAMPLSRSYILPRALVRFRQSLPNLRILVLDGPYADLLKGLRRGEIDFLIGALRDPLPIDDITQTLLFHDNLVFVARPGHPLAGRERIALSDLAGFPWVVMQQGTPIRQHFDRIFAPLGAGTPRSIIESGSIILMRQLLLASDHLGCISRLQAEAEIAQGLLARLRFDVEGSSRPIGVTTRAGWIPTPSQDALLRQLFDIEPEPSDAP